MNLLATIEVYAYGTSAGVLKEWETRPRAEYYNPHGRYMRLELHKPAGDAPILFTNDSNTQWYWSPDKTHLVIESQDEDEVQGSLGMGVKTVYSIPKENIAYWGEEEKSPRWAPRMNRNTWSPNMLPRPHA
jgi:hypothetical protein